VPPGLFARLLSAGAKHLPARTALTLILSSALSVPLRTDDGTKPSVIGQGLARRANKAAKPKHCPVKPRTGNIFRTGCRLINKAIRLLLFAFIMRQTNLILFAALNFL